MKYLTFTLVLTILVFSSCTKEEPRTAEQSHKTEEPKTGAVLIAEAKGKLSQAKEKLMQEGKYRCCIKVPCDRCALDHQSCPCYTNLKAGKSVCSDCYAGWQRGEGIDKEIAVGKVTMSSHKH